MSAKPDYSIKTGNSGAGTSNLEVYKLGTNTVEISLEETVRSSKIPLMACIVLNAAEAAELGRKLLQFSKEVKRK